MELSGRLDYLRKISAAGLIALAAWVSSFSPAHAIDFYNLRVADFPAHVRAIVFPSGNRIDSSSSTCWGNWCVTFGSEPPVAMLGHADSIRILHLECKNPVEGVNKCYMVLQVSHDIAAFIVERSGVGIKNLHINIQVPKDLILE